MLTGHESPQILLVGHHVKIKIMDPKNSATNLGGVSKDAELEILPLIM